MEVQFISIMAIVTNPILLPPQKALVFHYLFMLNQSVMKGDMEVNVNERET